MKLHFLNRSTGSDQSVSVTHNVYPNFLKVWHYHPELELALILKSTGTRFIGDNISKFAPGELVLLGENLPHMWLNDPVYFENQPELIAEAIAIHFKKDFLGEEFLLRPEMWGISELIEKAGRGIRFLNPDPDIVRQIRNLKEAPAFDRVLGVVRLLEKLNRETQIDFLVSPGYVKDLGLHADEPLNRIYAYVMKHFDQSIKASDVAQELGMNASAFSRYFSRIHRKTFTRYLNEVRIGYACKRLAEGTSNIAEICYESGFNNISNFNRQFKAIKKMPPKEYAKLYTINTP